MLRIIKHVLLALTYGILTSFLIFLGVYIYFLENRAELKPWHLEVLSAEFRADMTETIKDLDDYRKLEDKLFKQLNKLIYKQPGSKSRSAISRYTSGGIMDPQRFPVNWNRSFELTTTNPAAGVLVLHGLSDSPYSMKALGQMLHKQRLWVVGLRIPGHGTTPSGLLNVSWQDFTAAVRIAAKHLRSKIGPNKPLYIIGYSNGAALAVEYSLAVLEGEELPPADALILLSPAISVAPIAGYATWQARLARLFGLKKMLWSDIQPEFDPYKYNSFTVNAGDQIYQLTQNIAQRMQRLAGANGVKGFPKTLAFVSVVDATIPPATLIDALFNKLAAGDHQLVLFDVNRHAESEQLLRKDPDILTDRLLAKTVLPYDLTLLTNTDTTSNLVMTQNKQAGRIATTKQKLDMSWPAHLFSLSHVALPFTPDDLIYGELAENGNDGDTITLGSIWIRGERNLLQIPDNYFIRLRYNPFFAYMKTRTLQFLNLLEKTPTPLTTPLTKEVLIQ